jgi:Raf kinase inhibitor-like YbhB/YbcL family protein
MMMSSLIRNHAARRRMAVAALLAAVLPVMAGDKKLEGRNMMLTSTVFFQGGMIPQCYTCDGSDISPPLAWSGLPAGTKSLVLIVDDPDAPDPAAPRMIWSHWVLYNLPPIAGELPEGVPAKVLPQGTLQGMNDWQRTGYGGPCPPVGRHRYFYKLYALDVVLPDMGGPAKAVLEKAMQGHILGHAELMAQYQRSR